MGLQGQKRKGENDEGTFFYHRELTSGEGELRFFLWGNHSDTRLFFLALKTGQ